MFIKLNTFRRELASVEIHLQHKYHSICDEDMHQWNSHDAIKTVKICINKHENVLHAL